MSSVYEYDPDDLEMEPPHHVLDPEGQVILALRDPDAPFAVWKDGPRPTTPPRKRAFKEIWFRVSAKLLAQASPVFDKIVNGQWKESAFLKTAAMLRIDTNDWDAEALLISLYIVHGQLADVPRTVNLEQVAKIAVSYVFKREDIFAYCSATAICGSTQAITCPKLPIPERVIEDMNSMLNSEIRRIINALNNVADELCNDNNDKHVDSNVGQNLHAGKNYDAELHQNFECSSIMPGALMKHMRTLGLQKPAPVAPFVGIRYGSLQAIETLRSPNWIAQTPYYHKHHICHRSSFEVMFKDVYREIVGLDLLDYQC
ncbi:hypothetical protein BJX70DRAFT_394546 [Aspergillus crustosus]